MLQFVNIYYKTLVVPSLSIKPIFNGEINFDLIQYNNKDNDDDILIYSEGKIENKKKERRKEDKKKKEEVETSDEECADTQGKPPFRI